MTTANSHAPTSSRTMVRRRRRVADLAFRGSPGERTVKPAISRSFGQELPGHDLTDGVHDDLRLVHVDVVAGVLDLDDRATSRLCGELLVAFDP